MDARPEATVQIHPATAARLGIGDGQLATLSNARGIVQVRAEVTVDIRHDTVFLPFHYAGSECANLLTEAAVDPVSAMPEFKRTIVTVAPASGAAGSAGAAGAPASTALAADAAVPARSATAPQEDAYV